MKVFIHKAQSETSKAIVHKVLKWATEEVDNPDLRDRGFMYWRMLAINPAVAGEIVLAEKPAITTDSDRMDRGALDQLLLHTGTLGSIYHKNPEVRPNRPLTARARADPAAPQTFIRNAAGKALVDSPALNPLSRQVLVPVARPSLPSAISVPGPAPPEPSRAPPAEGKPTPPIPADADGDVDASSSGDHSADGEGEEDHIAAVASVPAPSAPAPAGGDPYANLGSAFGAYAADEPKPHTNDLLF